jgi:hypothetical protein
VLYCNVTMAALVKRAPVCNRCVDLRSNRRNRLRNVRPRIRCPFWQRSHHLLCQDPALGSHRLHKVEVLSIRHTQRAILEHQEIARSSSGRLGWGCYKLGDGLEGVHLALDREESDEIEDVSMLGQRKPRAVYNIGGCDLLPSERIGVAALVRVLEGTRLMQRARQPALRSFKVMSQAY